MVKIREMKSELQREATMLEIAAQREKELTELREFSAIEKETFDEAMRIAQLQKNADEVKKNEIEAENNTMHENIIDDTLVENMTESKANESIKREMVQLKLEMEQYKSRAQGYDLLKDMTMQNAMSNGDRKVLIEQASRIVALVDSGL